MTFTTLKNKIIELFFRKPIIVEHWIELESPLIEIDIFLRDYCQQNHMEIVKNSHDWPSRRLQWSKGDIERQLGVSLDSNMKTYSISGSAYLDENGLRWLKFVSLKDGILPPLSNAVIPEIDSWIVEINAIQRSELKEYVHVSKTKS